MGEPTSSRSLVTGYSGVHARLRRQTYADKDDGDNP